MATYKLSITGVDAAKTSQRIQLIATKTGDNTFLIKETRAEGSFLSGAKPIADASRSITLNNLKAVAKYPKAIGLIQWEAEITDQEGNFVKKTNHDQVERLQALIYVWGGLVGCDWA